MMNQSTRFLPLFGLFLITVVAVGCAQPGAGEGVLPTSPSSQSEGFRQPTAGPGASYNASGTWHFVTTDAEGNVIEDIQTTVSQDGQGNISFMNEADELVTLERVGTGVIILYRFSDESDEGGDCDVRVHVTARLDTRTNTLTGLIRFKELGCSNDKAGWTVTGTKLN